MHVYSELIPIMYNGANSQESVYTVAALVSLLSVFGIMLYI